jgi:hypothetical protein
MEACHAGTFTKSQLPLIAERSKQRSKTVHAPFESCPLCNYEPPDKIARIKLPKHISDHVKALAFLSLPWRDDIVEESNAKEGSVDSGRLASHETSNRVESSDDGDTSSDIEVSRLISTFRYEIVPDTAPDFNWAAVFENRGKRPEYNFSEKDDPVIAAFSSPQTGAGGKFALDNEEKPTLKIQRQIVEQGKGRRKIIVGIDYGTNYSGIVRV